MSQENLEVVRAALAAWSRRDWDEALKGAARDVEVDNSSNTGEWRGVHRGPDEVKRLWEKFMEPWASVSVEIDEIIEANSQIVTRLTGHLVGHDGIEVTTRTAWCWTFRDGQVTRVLISNELTEALEAAGLSE
jgi:ketosteroid isomerase-like protein